METEVKVELKYCERCGGLFFRRSDAIDVYCFRCEPEMRQMAPATKKPASREHWSRTVQAFGGVVCA